MPHGNVVDLTGQVFGALTVLELAEKREGSSRIWWVCRCECGQTIEALGNTLARGMKKACGVDGHNWRPARGQTYIDPNRRTLQPEYKSWTAMKQRCLNPNDDNYSNYGARGIRVCDRWLESFEAFCADMGPRPGGMSIERNDVNGDYEPGNCRWATAKEQARNKRCTIYVEHDGARVNLAELVERLGLSYSVVKGRLDNGWTLEEALNEPVREPSEAQALYELPDFPINEKPISKSGRKPDDLTGRKFGWLTVIEPCEPTEKARGPMWLCRCSCGREVEVYARSLRMGDRKACGVGHHFPRGR